MQNDIFSQPVDKSALALARSMALKESSTDGKTPRYDVLGDADTSAGAYQWNNGKIPLQKGQIPSNFMSDAKLYGLNPDDFSPENQDKVAYAKVYTMKKDGYTPDQIAASHNAGLGKLKNDAWKTNKGTTVINGKKIDYDTPEYVTKVNEYYQQLYPQMAGGQEGYASNANLVGGESNTTQEPKKDLLEKAGDVSKKILNFTGGNKVANLFGTLGAQGYEKAKGLLGGQDDSKYIQGASTEELDPVGTAVDAGKLGLSLLSTTGLIKGVGGLVGGAQAHTATNATGNLVQDITQVPADKFATLNPVEKINALQEALNSTKLASDKIVLQNAMNELAPKVLAASGVGSFSELHPVVAKALGLSAGALKSLGKLALLAGGIGSAQAVANRLLPPSRQ